MYNFLYWFVNGIRRKVHRLRRRIPTVYLIREPELRRMISIWKGMREYGKPIEQSEIIPLALKNLDVLITHAQRQKDVSHE